MPRPGFSVKLLGTLSDRNSRYGTVTVTNVTDARSSVESLSGGTNRPKKPVGWLPPVSYFLYAQSYRRAYGRSQYYLPNYNATIDYGSVKTGVIGCSPGGDFNSLNHFNELVTEVNAIDATLVNLSLIKARNKLKSQTLNLGLAWAERNQTRRLVGDTATRIARSFKHLSRGRPRRAMDELGISSSHGLPRGSNVPNKWLEMQYGWKPLLADVHGTCEALSNAPQEDWRVTVKGTASSAQDYSKVRLNAQGSWRGSAQVRNLAMTRIDAIPGNLAIIKLASLGLTNPLLIAWEKVPFSFVVDWFSPVGSWLSSLDGLMGWDDSLTYTSSSLLTKVRWDEWFKERTIVTGSSWYEGDFEGWKKMTRLDRTVSNGAALPSFPGVKDPRSLGHMANGLALLSQVFGRNPRNIR